MADSVAWGGLLGVLVDHELEINVQIRSFGAFDGTVPDPEALKILILEGVRRVALVKPSYLELCNHKDDVAVAAQQSIEIELRQMGVAGALTITGFTISEQDQRLLDKAVGAAISRR
jgi:hypothetical protein